MPKGTGLRRCRDCRRGLPCGKEYHIIGSTCWNGRDLYWYARKRWKVWAPKVLLITLALLLGGCSQTIATYKDGVATVKRNRFLMTEDIGSFSYDATDGSFTLDGYKSDMTRALMLIDKLAMERSKE